MKITFGRTKTERGPKSPVRWPLFLLSLPALVAIWSGWVGIGEMAGFGPVKLLPGISDFEINTAITLPVGLETYAAYSMYAWLTAVGLTKGTRRFAMWSAFGSLALGMAGQISYHLLAVAGVKSNAAPVEVVIGVSAIPVLVVGFGIGLAHAMHRDHAKSLENVQTALSEPETAEDPSPVSQVEEAEIDVPEPVQSPESEPNPVPAPRKPQTVPEAKRQPSWLGPNERYAFGVDIYMRSLEGPGRPLSQRDLATALGMKNRDLARQIISDVKEGKHAIDDALSSTA